VTKINMLQIKCDRCGATVAAIEKPPEGWAEQLGAHLCPVCAAKTTTVKVELVVVRPDLNVPITTLADDLLEVSRRLRGMSNSPRQQLFIRHDGGQIVTRTYLMVNKDSWESEA
jgi:hypothetical protein